MRLITNGRTTKHLVAKTRMAGIDMAGQRRSAGLCRLCDASAYARRRDGALSADFPAQGGQSEVLVRNA